MAKVVDFPAPLGPIMPKISPLFTSKVTLSTAVIFAFLEIKTLVRSLTSIIGSNQATSSIQIDLSINNSYMVFMENKYLQASHLKAAYKNLKIWYGIAG
jgi:cell division septal protein FtsQ